MIVSLALETWFSHLLRPGVYLAHGSCSPTKRQAGALCFCLPCHHKKVKSEKGRVCEFDAVHPLERKHLVFLFGLKGLGAWVVIELPAFRFLFLSSVCSTMKTVLSLYSAHNSRRISLSLSSLL